MGSGLLGSMNGRSFLLWTDLCDSAFHVCLEKAMWHYTTANYCPWRRRYTDRKNKSISIAYLACIASSCPTLIKADSTIHYVIKPHAVNAIIWKSNKMHIERICSDHVQVRITPWKSFTSALYCIQQDILLTHPFSPNTLSFRYLISAHHGLELSGEEIRSRENVCELVGCWARRQREGLRYNRGLFG